MRRSIILNEEGEEEEEGVENEDEEGVEVLPGAVHGAAPEGRADVVEVRLVDVVRGLGLHDVQLARQVEEVVVEVAVGHDLRQVVVVLALLGHLRKIYFYLV